MSLDPQAVARRLAELRALVAKERTLAARVAARLAELRALDELARYLHQG